MIISPIAASGNGHCGAADRKYRLPVDAVDASMRWRNAAANAGMLDVPASKSMSKPSTEAAPKGRRTAVVSEPETGPNIDQSVDAHVEASLGEVNPPSV